MKRIQLLHAEVKTLYNSNDTIKEVEIEGKGTIINFEVKTKINDRVDRSPVVFDKCCYFTDSDEKIKHVRSMLQAGNILDIKGYADRSKYVKDGVTKYADQIKVSEIKLITGDENTNSDNDVDDDLPF